MYVRHKDGTITKPDGTVLRDAQGRPVMLRADERLVVGADGKMYTKQADGTLIDSVTGKQILDRHGQPIVVPPGGRAVIGKDGKVLLVHKDGRITDAEGEVLRDRQGAEVKCFVI